MDMHEYQSKCPKCGKILNGVSLSYCVPWLCSDCDDSGDAIHSENGSQVMVRTFNAGHEHERDEAKQLLKIGNIYTVDSISVGGFSSRIYLKEFPRKSFNSVFFDRII